jgi:hypothetical protein
MSPLWLTFILQAALATESKVSVSGEVAQLEAAVLAKYGGENPSGAEQTSTATSPANPPPAEQTSPANPTSPATGASGVGSEPVNVSGEVAQLEAAVLAKYGGENPSAAEPTSTETSPANPPPAEETSPANPNSPATGASGVPVEVAQLEAAVLAKYGEKSTAETLQTSGLSIRKLDAASATTVEPANVKKAEPTTEEPEQAKYSMGSSLSRESFEELMQEGAGCVENGQCAAVHEAEESAPAAEESAPSKMLLKSSSPSSLTAEVEPAKAEAAAAAAAAPVEASPAPASRRKPVVMHDMPHYKHHGAHMVHVEAPERKSTSSEGLKQASEPSDARKAESLVQKRAEVEEFFHLAQNGVERIHSKEVEPKKPRSTAYSFFRTVSLFGILTGMAVLAYRKFDVIMRMSNGKGGFKAKNEDAMTSEFGV